MRMITESEARSQNLHFTDLCQGAEVVETRDGARLVPIATRGVLDAFVDAIAAQRNPEGWCCTGYPDCNCQR